ncbi:cryptochrome/photolyase family protein [Akkermansiaceae bacterium]|nr:cryptochrome/photolyase family protein [Akkermansiaceae bacterium]MDB4724967.1 cryptochrome/photolyase family protein [Akkermansiaceae bacterium]
MKRLLFLLGDQLSRSAPWLELLDQKNDVILLAEVKHESTKVWSHKTRTTLFLSAMRHFGADLEKSGFKVRYVRLDDLQNTHSLEGELERAIADEKPNELHIVRPGEHTIREALLKFDPIEHEDSHFFTTPADFENHAEGRKQLRMEYFYREQRKATGYLMDEGKPIGDQWNYDQDNRGSFDKHGPGLLPAPLRFKPDKITKEVIALVEENFADHPGDLSVFDWPVTPKEAEKALEDFIENRLPLFGQYQDAMWTDSPWLYHARLSAALNLKLLDPRVVCEASLEAREKGTAPLAAVEGFVRQILGWREYVRGLYWLKMPDYLEMNALDANEDLPKFFWTGKTEFTCLSDSLGQTLKYGYAHHIQRLMVTGLFSMMYGVNPKQIHEWYLAVYVDAVEWVELPNVTGMSQWADGGIMASKPYAATGKYIQRMSNYCKECPRNPAKRSGPDACPFTTLYWDFLLQHREKLSKNQRMSLQLRNLNRLSDDDITEIQTAALDLRKSLK